MWLIIKRTINGHVRYVEMLEEFFTDDATTFETNKGLNAFFVDCGKTYNGAAATVITGLSHLEGETVAILADGAVRTSQTVSGGQITIDRTASVVHVGLPYTGILQTMRPEMGFKDGTWQGRVKRISGATVRVHNSGTFKFGRDLTHLDSALFKTSDVAWELRRHSLPATSPSDMKALMTPTRLMIVQDKSLPLTVCAIIQECRVMIRPATMDRYRGYSRYD